MSLYCFKRRPDCLMAFLDELEFLAQHIGNICNTVIERHPLTDEEQFLITQSIITSAKKNLEWGCEKS